MCVINIKSLYYGVYGRIVDTDANKPPDYCEPPNPNNARTSAFSAASAAQWSQAEVGVCLICLSSSHVELSSPKDFTFEEVYSAHTRPTFLRARLVLKQMYQ